MTTTGIPKHGSSDGSAFASHTDNHWVMGSNLENPMRHASKPNPYLMVTQEPALEVHCKVKIHQAL